MLVLFCMRGCGCIARPVFPAPSDCRERDADSKPRAKTCGEIAKLCLYVAGCLKFESVRPSLRGAQATKQSIPRHFGMVRQHHTSGGSVTSKRKKYPDRCDTEGHKPGKRKPDKHVVSGHGRVLPDDVGLAAKCGTRRRGMPTEHARPGLVIPRQ